MITPNVGREVRIQSNGKVFHVIIEAKTPDSTDDASLVLGGQNLLTLVAYEEMHEFFNHTF